MHFYDKDGNPVYEVVGKNGKKRPTTVKDALTLKLVPSVTELTKQLDKPFLATWKMNNILEVAAEWPFHKTEYDYKTWCKEVTTIANNKSKTAQERGNKIHDKLENLIKKKKKLNKADKPLLQPVLELLESLGKVWVAEISFCKYGYGGKVDLSSECGTVVLDFKSKSVASLKGFKPYTDQCMQLAAYRKGLDFPTARCYNLFINEKNPSELLLHEWKEEDLQKAEKMFLLLRDYWYLDKMGGLYD